MEVVSKGKGTLAESHIETQGVLSSSANLAQVRDVVS